MKFENYNGLWSGAQYDDRPNDNEDSATELGEGNGMEQQVKQAELIEDDRGEHLSRDDAYRGRPRGVGSKR